MPASATVGSSIYTIIYLFLITGYASALTAAKQLVGARAANGLDLMMITNNIGFSLR